MNFVCTRGCGCFFQDRCWGADSHSSEDKEKWKREKDLKQELHHLRVEQTIARLLALQRLHNSTRTTTTTTTTSTKNTGTTNQSAIEAAAVYQDEAAATKKQAAIEKRQSEDWVEDWAEKHRKSVQEAKVKAQEKQKKLEVDEAAFAQAGQYYDKCSDQDLQRAFCALRGEHTHMKRSQQVLTLANSFLQQGILFRPKDGAMIRVQHYPSVDTTGAYVLRMVDSAGKTAKPPEEDYYVKPKRREQEYMQ